MSGGASAGPTICRPDSRRGFFTTDDTDSTDKKVFRNSMFNAEAQRERESSAEDDGTIRSASPSLSLCASAFFPTLGMHSKRDDCLTRMASSVPNRGSSSASSVEYRRGRRLPAPHLRHCSAVWCLFILAVLFSARAFAGPDGDFAVANRAFSEGDFAKALRAYERSVTAELHANALCNLGNTCFRLGKLGPAALSYERALALQPRLPDAVANLRLTREKSGARLLDQPWWEKALTWFSASAATKIALGTAWFFALVAASLAWRKKYGAAFFGSVIGVLIAAGYGAAIYWVTANRGTIAIVITERAAVHPEPAEHSKSAESLPGGSQVRVLGESGGWRYCRVPGGGRGWVTASSVEFLLPRGKASGQIGLVGAAGAVLPSLALVALTPAAARTADWRDEIWKKPGAFTALRPAAFHYAFGWSGITAAEADVSSTLSPEGLCVLDFSAKTTGLVRTMWKMDAKAVSSCDAATFHPVKLTQTETYKKKVVTTEVDFLADGPVQRRSLEPPDKSASATRKFRFPHVHDLNSAVLFIRSQALAQGDSVKLCVYPGGAPYLAAATVTGRERLTVAGREWDAIKCDLQLSGIQDDYTLVPHKKFKKASAWISDDGDRLLLKISAEVQVGSVWAELQSVDFSGKK